MSGGGNESNNHANVTMKHSFPSAQKKCTGMNHASPQIGRHLKDEYWRFLRTDAQQLREKLGEIDEDQMRDSPES